MKIIHIIDVKNEILLDIYFVDEETGLRVNYDTEEFLKSVKQ